MKEAPPVRVARNGFHFDGFARQRAWHVERADIAVCDSVAAMADPVDHQPLNHGPPR
jgi:hypothetical protein